MPRFPCLNSRGFPEHTPDVEMLESPFNYEVSCGQGLLGQSLYSTQHVSQPQKPEGLYTCMRLLSVGS